MSDSREYSIKPIETMFNDYRFRSRLEARWAIVLESIRQEWEYEKEGFDINGTWYLPDFFIHYNSATPRGWGFWLEIKPVPLTDSQIETLATLVRITGHTTYAACGNSWTGEHIIYVFKHSRVSIPDDIPWISDGQILEEDHHDIPEFIKLFQEWNYRLPYPKDRHLVVKSNSGERQFSFFNDYRFSTGNVSLMDAFQAARSARFEYGESPRIPKG